MCVCVLLRGVQYRIAASRSNASLHPSDLWMENSTWGALPTRSQAKHLHLLSLQQLPSLNVKLAAAIPQLHDVAAHHF